MLVTSLEYLLILESLFSRSAQPESRILLVLSRGYRDLSSQFGAVNVSLHQVVFNRGSPCRRPFITNTTETQQGLVLENTLLVKS